MVEHIIIHIQLAFKDTYKKEKRIYFKIYEYMIVIIGNNMTP